MNKIIGIIIDLRRERKWIKEKGESEEEGNIVAIFHDLVKQMSKLF